MGGLGTVILWLLVYCCTNTNGTSAGQSTEGAKNNEAFCLTLPGNPLDLSILLNKGKKFRKRGGKDAALLAMKTLQEDGLRRLEEKDTKGSVKVQIMYTLQNPNR